MCGEGSGDGGVACLLMYVLQLCTPSVTSAVLRSNCAGLGCVACLYMVVVRCEWCSKV